MGKREIGKERDREREREGKREREKDREYREKDYGEILKERVRGRKERVSRDFEKEF